MTDLDHLIASWERAIETSYRQLAAEEDPAERERIEHGLGLLQRRLEEFRAEQSAQSVTEGDSNVNTAAMRTVIDRIESLESHLAAARTELRSLMDGDEDAPIPLVPTARGERVGKRRPRPAPVTTPATRPSRRVAPEALEAVREALSNGPVPASVVASATELRHPTVLAALAQLVEGGVAVKTGSRRGARWGLVDG